MDDLNSREKYKVAIQKALMESRNPDTAWGRLKAYLEKNPGSKPDFLKRMGKERSLFATDLARLLAPEKSDLGIFGLMQEYGLEGVGEGEKYAW